MEAFNSIKEDLTKPTGLALYNLNAETLISRDLSSFRMGIVFFT